MNEYKNTKECNDIGINTLNWLQSGSEARAKQIAERKKKQQQNPLAALEKIKNQVTKKEEKSHE